jgi:UDP-N-acetylmuramate--alanine ligase
MSFFTFPGTLTGKHIHLVGAKGTGMCALAEILASSGAIVTGSDVSDTFYTDRILASLGITVKGFDQDNIDPTMDLVIHSAAYHPDIHTELLQAKAIGIPLATYPEALGGLSRTMDSSGICGVHGKTTTTALAGIAAKACKFPATILAGSAVADFGDRSTLVMGNRLFIAETCEYRRHFLSFLPRRIVVTSIESDHQDYYPDLQSIMEAFLEYTMLLPVGGTLIYCADDAGASTLATRLCSLRPDVRIVPFGFSASGRFRLTDYRVSGEQANFTLAGLSNPFFLRLPGRHLALDATAAIALCSIIADDIELPLDQDDFSNIALALDAFAGSRRRSEIIGEVKGVLIMDDYAHHPTAIKTTLAGLHEFYPDRRLVVDFMSHTASRTKALFDDFASAFSTADEVVMHRIYPSAREAPDPSVSGEMLYQAVKALGKTSSYFENPLDAADYLVSTLQPGDLFVTMGAGDNWQLGKLVYEQLKTGISDDGKDPA